MITAFLEDVKLNQLAEKANEFYHTIAYGYVKMGRYNYSNKGPMIHTYTDEKRADLFYATLLHTIYFHYELRPTIGSAISYAPGVKETVGANYAMGHQNAANYHNEL